MNEFQLSVFAARAPWLVHAPSIAVWLGRLSVDVPQSHAVEKIFFGDAVPEMKVQNGFAIIPVQGVLLNNPTFLERGFGAMGYRDVADNIDEALGTPGMRGIVLAINSPGGSATGYEELAGKVKSAGSSMPIIAFTDSLAASAAYWLALSASKSYCTPSATVGSIGTILTTVDLSRMYERAGITVREFVSGPYKNAGSRVTPMSDDHKSYFQSIVDESASVFKAAVRSSRVPDSPSARG